MPSKTLTHSGELKLGACQAGAQQSRAPTRDGKLRLSRSILHDFYIHAALARSVKLTQKDALPASQRQPAILDENDLARTDQRGLRMRIRIAFAVPVRSRLRHEAIENAFQIRGYIRIGVLVDGHSRRG